MAGRPERRSREDQPHLLTCWLAVPACHGCAAAAPVSPAVKAVRNVVPPEPVSPGTPPCRGEGGTPWAGFEAWRRRDPDRGTGRGRCLRPPGGRHRNQVPWACGRGGLREAAAQARNRVSAKGSAASVGSILPALGRNGAHASWGLFIEVQARRAQPGRCQPRPNEGRGRPT